MVISPQVTIKRNPEHSTLAEYLSDNPTPGCPIVGLDHISEFRPEAGVSSDLSRRPFYHCSVGECYNEQGNSRQMMQHLVRRHHVEGWLREREGRVPDSQQGVMLRCREIRGDTNLDINSLKVIISEELWGKCKKAMLRLGKEDAEDLYRREKKKTKDALKMVRINVDDDGLQNNIEVSGKSVETSPLQSLICKICKVKFLGKPEIILHYISKHFGEQMEQRFLTCLQGDPPLTCPHCPHTTVLQSGQHLKHHKSQLLYHLGTKHGVVEEMLASPLDSAASSTPRLNKLNHLVCKICNVKFSKIRQVIRHYIDKHFGAQIEQRFLTNFHCDPPLACPLCPHTTAKQTGQPHEIHRNQLLIHLGSVHKLVEEMLGSKLDSRASSPPFKTMGNALEETVMEVDDAIPAAYGGKRHHVVSKDVTIDQASEQMVDLLIREDQLVRDPTPTEGELLTNTDTIETNSEPSEKDLPLTTLNLSDIDPNIPADAVPVSDAIKDQVVLEQEACCQPIPITSTEPVIEMASGAEYVPSMFSPPRNKVSEPAPLPEDIVDLTGAGGQKKLSLKEYQEKLRKEKILHSMHEDVKPFEEDDEIEIVGFKEGNNKAGKGAQVSGNPMSEPPVKKEKPSGSQPQDLLERRPSGEVVVEFAVKAPPENKPNPMYIFKLKVTDRVKRYLLNYYAKDANDMKDRFGNPKVIKIRSQKEFETYCKTFSKKYQAGILDAYTSINGSSNGIESVDVNQYGIDHDIEKFFSEI